MRLLVVDDDTDISQLLKKSLEAESFSVDVANDGERGSYLARTNDYDLIMLDYMMPHKDGKTICKELRELGKKTPIIILTVKATVESKVDMLNTGADDYLTKPFSFNELLARIRALLRRPRDLDPTVYTVDNLIVDPAQQKVTRGGKEIYLTRKEFSLLEYLIRNRGAVVSRGMILEHVWDAEGDLFSNTIEAHIMNLRRKIDKGAKHKLIHTLPGRGYVVGLDRETPIDV